MGIRLTHPTTTGCSFGLQRLVQSNCRGVPDDAEVCAVQRFTRMFGWLYEHWGGMSQLILLLVAFVVSIRPKAIAQLEERPLWKIGIPLLVGIIGITGYITSESGSASLKSQLNTMYQQARIEATKDDIGNLTSHIDSGFTSVVAAIASISKQQHPVTIGKKPESTSSVPPLPLPPHITITQARGLSTKPEFQFALQVTIQADQQIPASFAIECTGSVGDVAAFMVGKSAYLEVMLGVGSKPNIALVHFGYPPLAPQSPMVVTIFSKDDIRVKAIAPY